MEWHSVEKEGFPSKSYDKVFCYKIERKTNEKNEVVDVPIFYCLSYSAKYKEFNMRDEWNKEDGDDFGIGIDFWMIPEI